MKDPKVIAAKPLMKRLTQVMSFGMTGGFFSPQLPLLPQAQETAGRRFDFLSGYNIATRPRPDPGVVDMGLLRNFAKFYDVLRIIIEKRKDQISAFEWSIKPTDEAVAAAGGKQGDQKALDELNKRAAVAQKFLQYPDGRTHWATWLRSIVEDLLVLDAICIWPVYKGTQLVKLETVDPVLIKINIDESGRVPEPPFPAYQQILHGLPASDYLKDELLYFMSNPASDRVYGYSKVAQIVTTIQIGLRREMSQLQFFTDGNIPAALAGVPDTWNSTQIQTLQAAFDAMMAGDTGSRRKLWFVPGDAAKNIKQLVSEEATLKAEFDEWLIRIICFTFGVAVTPFVKETNRACYSADTETLTENGWKRFDEISETEKIATVNPETKGLEFHHAVGLHVYPYEGDMVRFLTTGVDVLVTPDHDMWFADPRTHVFRKAHAEDLPRYQLEFQASVTSYDGDDIETFVLPKNLEKFSRRREDVHIKMDDWLALLGYYLSEGGLSHTGAKYSFFTLAQNPGGVAGKIQSLLERLPFKFLRYPPNDSDPCQRWNVWSKQLGAWLYENAGGRCQDKRVPRSLMSLGRRQLRILFDAMMEGDGSWDTREGRNSGCYYTTSSQLADDIQEIAFKLGYDSRKNVHYEANGNRMTAYRVSICERDVYSVVLKGGPDAKYNAMRVEPYDGPVYCFEVPNHLFVTRRNGKIGIHGNTAFTAQEQAREEGLGPQLAFLKNTIDTIITKGLRLEGVEFVWSMETENDPTSQATIDDTQLRNGLRSLDELRQRDGLEPLGMGNAIYLPTGPVLVKDLIAEKVGPVADANTAAQAAKNPPPTPFGGGQKPNGGSPGQAQGKGGPSKPGQPGQQAGKPGQKGQNQAKQGAKGAGQPVADKGNRQAQATDKPLGKSTDGEVSAGSALPFRKRFSYAARPVRGDSAGAAHGGHTPTVPEDQP